MPGHRHRHRNRHGRGEDPPDGDPAAEPRTVAPGAVALTEFEYDAVCEALDDEYKAWATYDQVIRDHGPVRPFTNIASAEVRHIEALTTILRRSGLDVPPNSWPGRVPRFESIRAACEAGVQGEIENAALYARLLASPLRDSLRHVLLNLQRASQERHLPALRRCATRASDAAGGPPGRRRRHGLRGPGSS